MLPSATKQMPGTNPKHKQPL